MLMCVAAALLASFITVNAPHLYPQGKSNFDWSKHASLFLNLNHLESFGSMLSFSEWSRRIYDSTGALTALWLLSTVTALAARSARATCLRISAVLTQALLKARTRRSGVTNYFTCQFNANYSIVTRGLSHACLNPCTHIFALIHVLLLACILCPASRILDIDSGPITDHSAWRRLNYLQWVEKL